MNAAPIAEEQKMWICGKFVESRRDGFFIAEEIEEGGIVGGELSFSEAVGILLKWIPAFAGMTIATSAFILLPSYFILPLGSRLSRG